MFELEIEELKKEATAISESLKRDYIEYRNATMHHFDLYTRSKQLEECALPKLFIRSGLVVGGLFATLASVGMVISKTSPYDASSLVQTGSKLIFGIGGVSTACLGIRNWRIQRSILKEFDDVAQFRKELFTSYVDFLEGGKNIALRSANYGAISKKMKCFQTLDAVVKEEEESFSITHFHLREGLSLERQVLKKDMPQVIFSPFAFFNEEEIDFVSEKETENREKGLVFSLKTHYTNNSKFWKRNSNKS